MLVRYIRCRVVWEQVRRVTSRGMDIQGQVTIGLEVELFSLYRAPAADRCFAERTEKT